MLDESTARAELSQAQLQGDSTAALAEKYAAGPSINIVLLSVMFNNVLISI